MRRLAILGLVVAALPSCLMSGELAQQPRLTTYDSTEYAPYAAEGTATIRGTGAFDGHDCAGAEVRLVPGTACGAEEFEVRMRRGPTTPLDPRAAAAERRVVADRLGRFEFDHLPPGRWFVLADVRWTAFGFFGPQGQGGFIGARVEDLRAGQVREVVLAR